MREIETVNVVLLIAGISAILLTWNIPACSIKELTQVCGFVWIMYSVGPFILDWIFGLIAGHITTFIKASIYCMYWGFGAVFGYSILENMGSPGGIMLFPPLIIGMTAMGVYEYRTRRKNE